MSFSKNVSYFLLFFTFSPFCIQFRADFGQEVYSMNTANSKTAYA